MKGMNYLEIAAMLDRLRPRFVGGLVQRLFQSQRGELAIDVRNGGENRWLFLSVSPDLARIHEVGNKPAAPKTPPNFCMTLRKHLTGGRIDTLYQKPLDRVVVLAVVKGEESFELIAELTGPAANAYLVDENGVILDLVYPRKARARDMRIGVEFNPLPDSEPPVHLKARDFGDDVEATFREIAREAALSSGRKRIGSALKKERKRAEKYIEKMEVDRRELEPPEELRKRGELLAIHSRQIEKGRKSITVPDIFLPDAPPITLPLDPLLDGSKNVEKAFSRAKKNELRLVGLNARIAQMEDRLLQLMELTELLDNVTEPEELREIDGKAREMGIGRAEPKAVKSGPTVSGPKEFVSRDGNRLFVGRNDRQNEIVTFEIARGNDYWFHVQDAGGSHVVALIGKKDQLKQETLLDAATLALLHSKLKSQGKGDVIYTQRKYVKKIKGGPAGKVIYSQIRTIHLQLESSRIERLVGKAERNY